MRPRLRYNKEDITENLFTTGSEWMTADGIEYKGTEQSLVSCAGTK